MQRYKNCRKFAVKYNTAMIDLLLHYFPQLTETQQQQFSQLQSLYADWNSKINVISRKDIDNLYERHVLHSLAIARILSFKPGSKVLDIGTGGGFPGVPLAILFPEVHFHLIDSIGKKIRVGTEVSNAIGLKNISLKHCRGEEENGLFDFVVSRAVMPLGDLVKIVRKNIAPKQCNALPNGIICLKGGALDEEIKPFRKEVVVYDLTDYFQEEFFETKKGIYLPLNH